MKNRAGAPPPLPDDLPLLAGPGSPLARAGAGDGKLFSITGRRAHAWGSGVRGVREIQAGRWTLLRDMNTGLGPASNVVVDPASVRREVTGPAGTVLETLLLGLTAPAAFLQWRRPEGHPSPLELELAWTVAWDGPETLRFESSADLARIGVASMDTSGDGPCALFVVRPAPQRWDLRYDERGVRVQAVVSASEGAVSVLLAGGYQEEDALGALRLISRARTEEVRAEQAIARAREEQLATDTGVAALDEGLEWAKARLRAAVSQEPALPASRHGMSNIDASTLHIRRGGGDCSEPSRRAMPPVVEDAPSLDAGTDDSSVAESPFSPHAEECWVGLGALAAGDPQPAEVILEGAFPTPYHLLVAARYVGWTGATGALLPHADRLDAAVARALSGGLTRVGAAALRELADAWESAGEKDRATGLRSASEDKTNPSASRGRRLPTLGGPAEGRARPEQELALAVFGQVSAFFDPGPTPPASSMERALRAWALCRAGDPETGYRLLRDHFEAGFRHGWGIWSDDLDAPGLSPAPRLASASGCFDHGASAALVPAALLFGLLGCSADAPVGRLRIAPRFPGAWRSFRVSNILVGDARVSLDYERTGGEHVFRIRQDRGRIPLMLVFEPEIAERDILETRVDAQPADLTAVPRRGRVSTRVQLPLESERVITLVGARGRADLDENR